ncbi:MAG: hypothetical protein ABSA47_07180 [Verrucomicrobiota bacterium]|jgi:hypothetical protein
MGRNRKSESGFRPARAFAALALFAVFVTLGVGYDWFKNQISVLGDQVKKSEIRLSQLERENRIRRDQLAALCSPVALDERVRKLNLGLGPPALAQVIRMTDAAPDSAAPPAELRQAGGGTLARNN